MIPRVSFSQKGEMMKKIIMVVSLVLCLGITVHASALPLPLPYVPPMEVEVYDALFNASGVTAVEESDEVKRLEIYLDLYRRVLGAGYESFLERIRDTVDGAKSRGQIVIGSDTATQLQQIVKYAMETGYSEDEEGQKIFPGYQEFTIWYQSNIKNIPISRYLYEQMREYWIANPSYTAAIGTMPNGLYEEIAIFQVRDGGTEYRPAMRNGKTFTNSSDGENVGTYPGSVILAFNNSYPVKFYYGISSFIENVGVSNMKKVVAKDTATQQAISAGKNAILTADSTLTESDLLDTTKPVVINIYRNITYPATTAEDIEEKQRELVVTNIATDEVAITQKETLEDIKTETYGDTETYKLDLLSFFPFCIPRDIMLLLQAFVAEPQTPEFDIPFPTWEDGQMTTMNYTLSLAQFEGLAAALRTFESIAFMIGLLVVTRQKYLRG